MVIYIFKIQNMLISIIFIAYYTLKYYKLNKKLLKKYLRINLDLIDYMKIY